MARFFYVFILINPILIIASWGGEHRLIASLSHIASLGLTFGFLVYLMKGAPLKSLDYIDSLLVMGGFWILIAGLSHFPDLKTLGSSGVAVMAVFSFYFLPKILGAFQDKEDLRRLLISISLVGPIYSLVGFIYKFLGGGGLTLFYKDTFVFSSVFPNPNGFGVACLAGFIAAYFVKREFGGVAPGVLAFLNLIFVLWSFSRGVIFPALVIIFLYEGFLSSHRRGSTKYAFIFLGGVSLTLIVLLLFNFAGPKASLVHTFLVRLEIWEKAFDAIGAHFLFGYGESQIRSSFNVGYLANRTAHNSFVDTSLKFGVLPGIFFGFWFLLRLVKFGYYRVFSDRETGAWSILWLGVGALFLQAFVRNSFVFSSSLALGVVPFYLILATISKED